MPRSRALGTGIASRYRRLPQLASLATVSPLNSATTTVSRKPEETSSVKSVKLGPPWVARSARAENSPPPPLSALLPLSRLSWNASRMISGSTSMNPSASWVRRRDACRRISVRSVNVLPAW